MERIVYNEELHNLCLLDAVINVSELRRIKRTKYEARISVLVVKIENIDC